MSDHERASELDPDAAELLADLSDRRRPANAAQTVESARRAFRERCARLSQARPVDTVEEFTVDGPEEDLPLRLYADDEGGEHVRGGLVWFHGGGWVLGDLDTHDGVCRELAGRTGRVVVAVDYRLAPEHPFPAPLVDCHAATEWVVANADALGIDPDRVAVGGQSAGGTLAAAVSLLAAEAGPDLAAQLLVYPALDTRRDTDPHRENAEGYLLTSAAMAWYWEHYIGGPVHAANPYAVPARATDERLRGQPPAVVLTCGYDPLRDEGDSYAERLRAAGTAVEQVQFPALPHGFLTMGAAVDAVDEALDALAAGLDSV
ncbi:MAG: alpha/beta hydrolase [Haloarculaceae archaeon]